MYYTFPSESHCRVLLATDTGEVPMALPGQQLLPKKRYYKSK